MVCWKWEKHQRFPSLHYISDYLKFSKILTVWNFSHGVLYLDVSFDRSSKCINRKNKRRIRPMVFSFWFTYITYISILFFFFFVQTFVCTWVNSSWKIKGIVPWESMVRREGWLKMEEDCRWCGSKDSLCILCVLYSSDFQFLEVKVLLKSAWLPIYIIWVLRTLITIRIIQISAKWLHEGRIRSTVFSAVFLFRAFNSSCKIEAMIL